MLRIGAEAHNIIQTRTRLGKGVSKHLGSESPLKPLEVSTLNQRRRDRLSPLTRPKKSNLTKTGDMLNAMDFSIPSRGKVTLTILDSSRDDAKITNRRLAEIHQNDKGRPFFHMSRRDFKKIFQYIRREIVKPLVDRFS